MSDNKRSGRSSGKGYYIALILCAAAIGITSYVYQRNTKAAQQVAVQETTPDTVSVQIQQTEDVPVLATVPKETTAATSPAATTQEPTTWKTTAPVAGQTIGEYSMEALSYNQTTRDWRVHNGVDIAAEEGTPVCAAADGEVSAIYEDDSLGKTVVIRHADGYETTYASLAAEVTVKAGDTVELGQTIGYVGQTALVETALGAHVHFSVTCQAQPVDPAQFLALGQ